MVLDTKALRGLRFLKPLPHLAFTVSSIFACKKGRLSSGGKILNVRDFAFSASSSVMSGSVRQSQGSAFVSLPHAPPVRTVRLRGDLADGSPVSRCATPHGPRPGSL